jgi:hypothetical protein
VKALIWLVAVISLVPRAHGQEFEKVQPTAEARGRFGAIPVGLAGEVKRSFWDFATFRDPQWSSLTLAQIDAATGDAVTSLNNLHGCAYCEETGPSRIFVGRHPDAHKYVLAGLVEISVEAVTTHYARSHGPMRKWYWKALWTLPQSVSLYEHARATYHNAALRP